MTTLSILGHGVFVFGLLTAAFARKRIRTRETTPLPDAADASPGSGIPENATLAGVPLKILLSDRSGPGAVLRDTLMTGPLPPNL
jgi:hypothetical protein